jgi:TANFOR domain-containing protein
MWATTLLSDELKNSISFAGKTPAVAGSNTEEVIQNTKLMKTLSFSPTFLFSCLACLLLGWAAHPVVAQTLPIKLVITVTPPYPVSVSYYADHPQQVVVQLINQSRQEQRFRLVGSINGLDNNVKVVAKDRGASGVITLNPLESRLLTVVEIQDLFDARKLAFTGINYRRTQIDDGLPEGLYTICAYAVDAARTNLQVSEQTCSNSFPVTNLEPPILIHPAADAHVPVSPVQNLLFTWTLPASAPPTTEYTLRMVEVVPGMNPNNALQSATVPVFFERTVQVNTLLYGPADPPLVAGRTYAYMVTAKDPMQKAVFRNGGRSEVHVFTYQSVAENESPVAIMGSLASAKPVNTQTNTLIQTKNLSALATTIKGRLVYAFAEDYQLDPFPESKKFNGATPWKEADTFTQLKKSNFKEYHLVASANDDRETCFSESYLAPKAGMQPLKGIKVSLMMVYAFKGSGGGNIPSYDAGNGWRILTGFVNGYDLDFMVNGKNIENEPVSKVLDSKYTSANGEFTFDFNLQDTCRSSKLITQKVTADDIYGHPLEEPLVEVYDQTTLYRTCVLVVESPHYCTPSLFLFPHPGDHINVYDQVSIVKTFQRKLFTVNDNEQNQAGGNGFAAISGVPVEVFRIKSPADAKLPAAEGQNLPATAIAWLHMGNYAATYPIDQISRVVALGKTEADGSFTVSRLFYDDSHSLIAHGYTSDKTGVYTKQDALDFISRSGAGQQGLPSTLNPYLVFNNEFRYERDASYLMMSSKKPRVAGKVVEQTKGLVGVMVYLIPKLGKGLKARFISTDKDGYFDFVDIEPYDYMLYFNKEGYQDFYYNNANYFPLQMGQLLQTNEITLKPAGRVTGLIRDEDGNPVTCDVQIADGAFCKTFGTGGYFDMPASSGKGLALKIYPRSDQYFPETYTVDVPKAGVTNIKAGTLTIYRRRHRIRFLVKATTQSAQGQQKIANATITLKGIKNKTDANGMADFVFESPGETFWVSVKPEAGSNFSHWEGEIAIPVSRKPTDHTVLLEQGKSIEVTVTDNHGKQNPAKGVKVYIKTLNNTWENENANYTEATTDEKGMCTLTGIPVSENTVEVFVYKEPDANGSYSAASQSVGWPTGQKKSSVVFQLKTYPGFTVNSIWGFPVRLEAIKELGNHQFQASGSFVHLPGNPNFSALNSDSRLDFKNVTFVVNPTPTQNHTATSGTTQNTSLGTINTSVLMAVYDSHIPKESMITTLQHELAVQIYKKLQGNAQGVVEALNGNPKLKIAKDKDGKATLNAQVRLDLASFKGAYQLSGDITLGNSKTNPMVTVLKANPYPKQKFWIGQGKHSFMDGKTFGPLLYKVHQFKAESDIEKSYVYADSVRLFTVLHTDIPTMVPADLKLQAGYITILPNTILPFEGGNQLTFGLEKWKVSAQKPTAATGQNSPIDLTYFQNNASATWAYDKNNGGIVIPKASVNTGLISVGLKNLIIKPDRLIGDKMELNQSDAAALTLGGIVPLEVMSKTTFQFSYDPNCYHDNKPHWKLSLLNPSGKAAQVSKLDGLEDGQKLEFGSMNLFSDNQQQLSGYDAKPLTFRRVLQFQLNSIDVGSDYFTMVGQASMKIPNMTNGGNSIASQLQFTKSGNKSVLDFKPLYFNVETAGKVSFQATDKASTQTLANDRFTALGTLTVYDDATGKSFPLQGRLFHQRTKDGYDTYIEIAEQQKFPLNKKYLQIVAGIDNSGIRVKNNTWEKMSLKTILPEGTGGFELVKSEEQFRTLTLKVNGAIQTDPSSGAVGIKGMETGMGSISMFYDFTRQEFTGNFFVNPPPQAPIKTGIVDITSSDVTMSVGSNGILILTKGTGTLAPAGIPLPLDAKVVSVVGYYTQPFSAIETDKILSLAVHKELPELLKNGIRGMYGSTVLAADVLDKSFGKDDIPGLKELPDWLADFDGHAKAGLAYESRYYANAQSLTRFDVSSESFGYGFADIGASANILSIEVKGGVKFDVQTYIGTKISPSIGLSTQSLTSTLKSLTMEGCGSVGGSFYLGACIGDPTGITDWEHCEGFDVNGHVSVHFTIHPAGSFSDAAKVWVTLDDCGNNGMPVNKLNESGY